MRIFKNLKPHSDTGWTNFGLFSFLIKITESNQDSQWVVFTPMAKVSQDQPFLIDEEYQPGWNSHLKMWNNSPTNWLRRVSLHRRSVLYCEILMVLPKWDTSLGTRFWEFWKPKDWPHLCLRICTVWSRKLLLFANIWNETERTGIQNSAWFWLKQEFIDWHDITRQREHCPQLGDTNLQQHLLWLLDHLYHSL